jgi:hypothetical protein
LAELLQYPLYEELRPVPPRDFDGPKLAQLGAQVEASLRSRNTPADVEAILSDALEEGLGVENKRSLQLQANRLGISADKNAARAALGALTLSVAERYGELKKSTARNRSAMSARQPAALARRPTSRTITMSSAN